MVAFGIEFRNLGVSLGSLAMTRRYLPLVDTRLLSFGIVCAWLVVIALYLFLSRSYLGAAIRAISQDREIMTLMGVNTKQALLCLTSAIGGGLAGLAAAALLVLAIRCASLHRSDLRTDHIYDLRDGRSR